MYLLVYFLGSKRKECNLQGTLIKLSMYFSAETLQARIAWDDIVKGLKEKHSEPKILYLEKLFG